MQSGRCRRFSFLFARPFSLRLTGARDGHPHPEGRRVVPPELAEQFVDGGLEPARCRNLLKQRLGVLRRLLLLVEIGTPTRPDDPLRRVQSAIQQEGAHQRLDNIADDIVACLRAILACLPAEAD